MREVAGQKKDPCVPTTHRFLITRFGNPLAFQDPFRFPAYRWSRGGHSGVSDGSAVYVEGTEKVRDAG